MSHTGILLPKKQGIKLVTTLRDILLLKNNNNKTHKTQLIKNIMQIYIVSTCKSHVLMAWLLAYDSVEGRLDNESVSSINRLCC